MTTREITKTSLSPDDLADRLARGGVTHVLTATEHTAQFVGIADDLTRIAVGGAPAAWLDYAGASGEFAFALMLVAVLTVSVIIYDTSHTLPIRYDKAMIWTILY